MTHLYLLTEKFTNGFDYNIIDIISIFSIICAICIIINKNPIVSVLFLIGLFLNIATYLMMLGINFIGLSYLLVYVGAVSILFLFILMLINVRVSELINENNNSLPLAIVIGIFFSYTSNRLLPYNNNYSSNETIKELLEVISSLFSFKWNNSSSNELFLMTSQNWDSNLTEFSHITSIGNVLYTAYPLLLILTSLILLLAMVGSIIITIKQK